MHTNTSVQKKLVGKKENSSDSTLFDLAVKTLTPQYSYKSLTTDQKLYGELFRSRYNFISGLSETDDGTEVSWTTCKWKLSDSELFINWDEPNKFRGVGFHSSGTYYALLDIDKGSEYHPNYGSGFKPMELIETCLKSVGLNRVNWYRSSGSGGYHGYIPFNNLVSPWATACILEMVLTKAGFVVKPGQLEIFPNTKSSKDSNYKCHRLPLQKGFAYEEGYDDYDTQLSYFLEEWQEAAAVNDSDLFISHSEAAKLWLKKHRRLTNALNNPDANKPRNTGVIAKWNEEYQELLTTGWTGRGQSQHIFCSVVKWNRVFNNEAHTVEDLTKICVAVVKAMPGFKSYSRHCRTVTRDLRAWCKTYWKKYKPYREAETKEYIKKAPEQNQNGLKASLARQKITQAVQLLIAQGKAISQKAVAKAAGVSPHTVKKHIDLLNKKPVVNESVVNESVVKEPEESFVNEPVVNKIDFVKEKNAINIVNFVKLIESG